MGIDGEVAIRRSIARPLVLSVVTVALFAIATREGIALTPDGWAHWEGAVSLIEGCGWRYISGPPILDWPPLFTWYLVVVQYLLGIHAGSLAVASGVLLATSTFGWLLLLTRTLHLPSSVVVLGGSVHMSLFLLVWHSVLLSELLTLALLPPLLHVIAEAARSRTLKVQYAGVVMVLLTAMLLTRHACLAWAAATLVALLGTVRGNQARAMAIGAVLVPVVLWRLVNTWLGLPTETRADWNATLSNVPARFDQALTGFWWLLATSRGALHMVAAIMVVGTFVGGYRSWFDDGRDSSAMRALLTFTASSVLFLVLLLAAANAADPLGGRFLLYVALMVTVLITFVAASTPARSVRLLARVTLLFLVAMQSARVAEVVRAGSWSDWAPVVPLQARLSARGATGAGYIAPPEFAWVMRDARNSCQR